MGRHVRDLSERGHRTTGRDVVRAVLADEPERLNDAKVIVTGGYSGIGREVVRALSTTSAQVIVPARNTEKASSALSGLSSVSVRPMDLMDPESIDSFVEWFTQSHSHLDYLVGCAGIMAPPLRRDSRGYESQFSTNHLGHFQLAQGLAQSLVASRKKPRLVLVSSRAQRAAGNLTGEIQIGSDGMVHAGQTGSEEVVRGINFADPNWETTPYRPMLAYAQSKTANVLCAVEFDRRYRDQGVRAFAAHPGLIPGSDLGRSSGHEAGVLHSLLRFAPVIGLTNAVRRLAGQVHGEGDLFKTPAQGAGNVLWCALSPDLDGQGGTYCEDCHVSPVVDDPESASGVLPWAVDPEAARKLWDLSEELIHKG